MERKAPNSSRGYQKKIHKNIRLPFPSEKKAHDYSSAIAKKIPLVMDALSRADSGVVQKFIEDKRRGKIVSLLLCRTSRSPFFRKMHRD